MPSLDYSRSNSELGDRFTTAQPLWGSLSLYSLTMLSIGGVGMGVLLADTPKFRLFLNTLGTVGLYESRPIGAKFGSDVLSSLLP